MYGNKSLRFGFLAATIPIYSNATERVIIRKAD